MKTKTEIYVLLMGVGFLVFGIAYLVFPFELAGFSGYIFSSAAGATEMRAIYGGFQVGAGLFILWCSQRQERTETGLLLIMLIFSCVGVFRAIGLIVDQTLSPMHQSALPFELGCALVTVVILRNWISRESGQDNV